MGRKRKPNYARIAALEAELDADGNGLFDVLDPEPLPEREPPKKREREMTAEEATERLDRVARGGSLHLLRPEPYPIQTVAASAYSLNYVQIVPSPYPVVFVPERLERPHAIVTQVTG